MANKVTDEIKLVDKAPGNVSPAPVNNAPEAQNQHQLATPEQAAEINSSMQSQAAAAPDYKARTQAEIYDAAQKRLTELDSTKPGAYSNQYADQINDLYNQIVNREKFTYDLGNDTLYNQYRDQYAMNGQLASQNAQAQAAALTGGYGSTYGQAVGQQQYNSYLQQLNDIVPDLYRNAQAEYEAEGNRMQTQYGMLQDREAQDYSRWNDDYNRWQDERGMALDDEDRAMKLMQNEAATALNMIQTGTLKVKDLSPSQLASLQRALGLDANALQNYLKAVTPKAGGPVPTPEGDDLLDAGALSMLIGQATGKIPVGEKGNETQKPESKAQVKKDLQKLVEMGVTTQAAVDAAIDANSRQGR